MSDILWLLHVLEDEVGSLHESFFYTLAGLGRGFHKYEAVFVGKRFCFFKSDISSIFEILLVTNQHDNSLLICEVAGISQPRSEVVEGRAAGNIVNQQRTSCASIVASRDSSETFLARSIPDLNV